MVSLWRLNASSWHPLFGFSGFGGLLGFLSEHLRSFGSHCLHGGLMSRTGTALASETVSVG